jgi:hypothetical protein
VLTAFEPRCSIQLPRQGIEPVALQRVLQLLRRFLHQRVVALQPEGDALAVAAR